MSTRVVPSDAATTRALRRSVLRPTWPEGAPVHGDDAPDALHLAALDGDALVGACLLLPRAFPARPDEAGAWQLRGMATVPELQGQGIGGRVLGAALDLLRERDARLLWCEARTSALAFYAQHGFAPEGPQYPHAETGAPHQLMWRPVR